MKMKKVVGTVYPFTYDQHKLWAAKMQSVSGSVAEFQAYGYSKRYLAIRAANAAAKKLGWELSGPWERIGE